MGGNNQIYPLAGSYLPISWELANNWLGLPFQSAIAGAGSLNELKLRIDFSGGVGGWLAPLIDVIITHPTLDGVLAGAELGKSSCSK